MGKLSIYDPGTFFRPDELAGKIVQRVGGGTGFRSVTLALPDGTYQIRVRAKGAEYKPGEFMLEKCGKASEIEAWEDRVAAFFGNAK